MGWGKIELAGTLFGELKSTAGTMTSDGKVLRLRNTADARRAGVAFVPESRRSMLFYQEPVYKNMSISVLGRIARLWLKPATERDIARRHVEALSIRPPTVEALLHSLSGGNQQKVALAKWLTWPPRMLVLCGPTRGIDVGVKEYVVKILRGLRDSGLGIVVLSTEPRTVLS